MVLIGPSGILLLWILGISVLSLLLSDVGLASDPKTSPDAPELDEADDELPKSEARPELMDPVLELLGFTDAAESLESGLESGRNPAGKSPTDSFAAPSPERVSLVPVRWSGLSALAIGAGSGGCIAADSPGFPDPVEPRLVPPPASSGVRSPLPALAEAGSLPTGSRSGS
jgi:hypothetical protein